MGQGYTKGIPIDVDSTFSANSDALVPSQKAVKSYVDNGLATKQNTLTGSESVLIPNRLLFKQNTTTTHTGTLTETVIYSYLISASTIELNDTIEVFARFFANNSANTKTLKFYLNTSASAGGQQFATLNISTASVGGSSFTRQIVMKNSLSSQEVLGAGTSYLTDYNVNSGTLSSLTADFGSNVYVVVSATLTNIADSCGFRNILAKLLR